jgi:hypothetical protein
MTVARRRSASVVSRLALGAVLGSGLGTIAAALGVPGLVLLGVVVARSALIPPRYAFLAGVLIGAGGVWLFFSTRAVVVCQANPSSCSGPAPEPFAVVSGIVVAVGVVALIATRRRLGRSRDISEEWGRDIRSVVRGVIGLVAAGIVLSLVFYVVWTDPTPFKRAVNDIPFPVAWARAGPDVEHREFLFGGARFDRFYLIDGDPTGIAADVSRVVTAAGYTPDPKAPSGCSQNPRPGGPTTCSLGAVGGNVHLWIVVWDRGEAGPLLRGAPGLCVLRIEAGHG